MAGDVPPFFDPVEDCPWRSPREIFACLGYAPLPPDQLDDRQLPGRLWELTYAAAGRRFFFHFTNHLSDRQFYTLLWEQWLDEQTADIPLEAETNTRLLLTDLNACSMTHTEIWLRYYAGEEDREEFSSSDPNFVLPAHQDPPYDRDRFLPDAPIPRGGSLSTDGPFLEDDEPDPLGLADVDREIAAAKATEAIPYHAPNEPLDDTRDIEKELLASEPENWVPPAKILAEEHVSLLPPAEITDDTLTPILWELLHNLALRGFYVLHSNHLSDRELYAELWHHGLHEPAHLPGRTPHAAWFHDILGSWGDEQMQIWLRYHATEEERTRHQADWPKEPIPPRENPPFNRDWRLPKAPFE